jgi:hypothetical protein
VGIGSGSAQTADHVGITSEIIVHQMAKSFHQPFGFAVQRCALRGAFRKYIDQQTGDG